MTITEKDIAKEQPAPVSTDNSKVVWPELVKDIKKKTGITEEQKEKMFGILKTRISKGLISYGTCLKTFNGRDAQADAVQEFADLLFYLKQLKMEKEAVGNLDGALLDGAVLDASIQLFARFVSDAH